METIGKYLLAAAIGSLAPGAAAEINIDFESCNGIKAISMYDAMWEESPFRTGELTGNWAITDNPDTSVNEIIGEAPNPSAKVLGARRSRFGGNRFGVRIDLEETFELTHTPKYVHVMMYRPNRGRIMLVGLGSRTERKGQNPYCEQFWVTSSNSAEPGIWSDVVFAVKGAGGIDVRSLVVVPDMESPHGLTEDFLFYVDNIEVNDTPTPRIIYEYYPVHGAKGSSPMTRTDRVTDCLSLTVGEKTYSVPVNQQANQLLYQDMTGHVFNVRPGQTISPALHHSDGDGMNVYAYIDYNNDGLFAADGSELVSTGSDAPDGGRMPGFALPADLRPGMYRMRLKLDLNSTDPKGNPGQGGRNSINDNGGVIADIMLNVHSDYVTVNDFQLNGEVLAADGRKLDALKTRAGQPFTIMMKPENGFVHDGVDIRIGYNLDGNRIDRHGNPQYVELYVPASEFTGNRYTIPADKMYGDLLINGRMVESSVSPRK